MKTTAGSDEKDENETEAEEVVETSSEACSICKGQLKNWLASCAHKEELDSTGS